MPGMFCRHNRLISKCSICSRELDQRLREQAPVRHVTVRRPGASSTPKRPASTRSGSGRLVTRKLERAADDGYRNPLVPGLKATADAERLARAVTLAHARLEPPGPHRALDETADVEHATWLAFLLALAPDLEAVIDAARPAPDADLDELPAAKARTAAAYRAWAARAGGQEAAFTGEESWTPERRFGRVFERLALPGFTRAMRYDLLATLGAADIYPLAGDALHFVEDDATTLAAKRALVSGDRMLLERRARDLADASELPIAAFDRGLAVWGTPTAPIDDDTEPDPGIAAALGLG
ncbi:MAG TPA: hypothetical protein VNS09_04985 [Solirubrobacter sp.]|nr:hypothetical protein [Solirubrobacter sp.]